MKNENGSLFGTNQFAKAFAQFDEQAFFKSLHNQVRNRSYFKKYKGFKTTVLWLSYLFNVASGATACYAVYWLTKWLTGFEVIAWVIALIFLFFLEKIKRKSSTEFWQVLFFRRKVAAGWLGLSLFCFAISLASSSFGVKEGTEKLGPGANLIAMDSTAQAYSEQLAKLEADNLKLEQQRTRSGVIYWPAQKEKEMNKKMIAQLQEKIIQLDTKLEGKNDVLSDEYQEDIKLTAWTLVYVTIAMEILFELCIAFVWFYYFKSYVERKLLWGIPKDEEEVVPELLSHSTEVASPSQEELMALVLSLQKQLDAVQQVQQPQKQGVHQNGQPGAEETGGVNNRVNPILGFLTDDQRKALQPDLLDEKSSEQTLADVSRENMVRFEDRFTIVHRYMKGNQEKQVRYTLPRIESRLAQYRRELEEAQTKGMDEGVVENRRNWIVYWESRREELLEKIQSPRGV